MAVIHKLCKEKYMNIANEMNCCIKKVSNYNKVIHQNKITREKLRYDLNEIFTNQREISIF